MQKIELEVKPRELGEKDHKKTSTQMRAEGWVPGVIYGHGKNVSIAVDARAFQKATHTKAGTNTLFTVKLGNESSLTVIKEVQRDILTHKPIHVDFLRIDVKEKLEMAVPTHVFGEAPGVKNSGGILEQINREIRVRCLPENIPASIDVDVSQLEMGHGIKVKDLKAPEGVEFLNPPDQIIVTIVAQKVEAVAAPTATEGAVASAAEPEVIAKGKKDEEGVAGATPAAGAAPAGKGGAPAAGKAAAPAGKEEKKK